jgi:hypothetical protein
MFTYIDPASGQTIYDSLFSDTFKTVCPSPFTQADYVPAGGYTITEYNGARCDWSCVPNVVYREHMQNILNACVTVAQVLSFLGSLHLFVTWLWLPKKRNDVYIVATGSILLAMSLHSIGQWFITYNQHFTSTICIRNVQLVDKYYPEAKNSMLALSAISLFFLLDLLVIVWMCHVVTIAITIQYPHFFSSKHEKHNYSMITVGVCVLLSLLHALLIYFFVPLQKNYTAYILPNDDAGMYSCLVPQWVCAFIGTAATLFVVFNICRLDVLDEDQKKQLNRISARLLVHSVVFIVYNILTIIAVSQVIAQRAGKRALDDAHHVCAKGARYLIGYDEFTNCPLNNDNDVIWYGFHILLAGAGAFFWPVYGTMSDNYTICCGNACMDADNNTETGTTQGSQSNAPTSGNSSRRDSKNEPGQSSIAMATVETPTKKMFQHSRNRSSSQMTFSRPSSGSRNSISKLASVPITLQATTSGEQQQDVPTSPKSVDSSLINLSIDDDDDSIPPPPQSGTY